MPVTFRELRPRDNRAMLDVTARLMIVFELAFFCHALKCFAGIFDPILIIVAIGRQQLDHLVGAARAGTANRTGRVQNRLADPEFVRPQQRRAYGDLRRHCHCDGRDSSAVFRLSLAGSPPRNCRFTNTGPGGFPHRATLY